MHHQLKPGDKLNNDQICEIFKCSPQGGMRKSKKTNSLVLISNHIKSIYDDRWIDDTLYYTGMGSSGNQRLDSFQNKTLAESETNNIKIHLFEVFKDKEYVYAGQVFLSEEPFTEKQLDQNGIERDVYVFKLKLLTGATPIIDSQSLEAFKEEKKKNAVRLSNKQLIERVMAAQTRPSSITTTTKQFIRNSMIAEYTKRLAKGKCMLCMQDAPFTNSQGEPYLEVHHLQWLSKGGEDSIDNTVALCPNCHRKMHIVNSQSDIDNLRLSLKNFTILDHN